ncbi:MAG: thermonuclease family protein [Acidobacteriota bacterium]|nr:MAG: thermonuclease family protein [Acidobacteriota bacterium]
MRILTPILLVLLFSACSQTPERRPGDTVYPSPSAAPSAEAEAKANAEVVGVNDGDTIAVRFLDSGEQMKVRLATIDAPEQGQPFGAQAKKSLSDLVFGKRVRIVEVDRDRYGRIVGEVFDGNLNVNVEQIRRGFAWHFKEYQRQQTPEMRSIYSRAEDAAKQSRNGLWREQNPVPPWMWRKERESTSKT